MDNPALGIEPTGQQQSQRQTRRGSAAAVSTPLDRTVDLSLVSWVTITWVIMLLAAIGFRLTQLDLWALSSDEAHRSFDAYRLYTGRPDAPGEDLPTTGPLFLLLQSLGFFLFSATDAVARLIPALSGVALIPLAFLLRPFVGKPAALGMAILLAFSPTLVYASRVVSPDMLIGGLALLLVVVGLRMGLPERTEHGVRSYAVTFGAVLAAMLAAGPAAITVLIGIAVGTGAALAVERRGGDDEDAEPSAVRRSLVALRTVPGAAMSVGVGLLGGILVLFTRLFSELPAITGIVTTFADWGRMLGSGTPDTPTQFFLLASFLYEPLALIFALVAVTRNPVDRPGGVGWPFFAGWFATTLLVFGFSTGRDPLHAAHVALPLVLLGGGSLGDFFARVDWRDMVRGKGRLVFLTFGGILVGLIALAVIGSRRDNPGVSTGQTFSQLAFVLILVVIPLVYAAYTLVRDEARAGDWHQPLRIALLVLSIVIGAVVFRSSVMLNFYNADSGHELLAQQTSTGAVRPMIDRLLRLARDTTVDQTSIRDNTGGRGLVIATDARVRWPFQWYFRDFPDFTVVAAGQALAQGAEVVIAPTDEGMAEAGFTPRAYPYKTRVPATYADPETGQILLDLILPGRWLESSRYVLYRDLDNPAVDETVAIGLNAELSSRVMPNSGPFDLYDRAGAGSGRGQFNGPRGIAVSPDGTTVYVVDMANFRVERFDFEGPYIGTWGGSEEGAGIQFGAGPNGLGPTGIAVSTDGLVYIADTWNHRVVALDEAGNVVREIGSPGQLIDQADDPSRVAQDTGLFYGPRGVAIYNDEIFVTDTGNERVQVFGLDGTFRRAFGGWGSDPGRLLEPVGITIGPDGLVYVADSNNGRISVFTVLGEPVQQWPVAAWQGSTYVEPYLTFGTDDLLYATSKVTGSVEVIGAGGTLVESITAIDGEQLDQPVGIATAPDGTILITDAARPAIYSYVPETAGNGASDDDSEIQLPVDDGSEDGSPVVIDEPPAATPESGGAAPTSEVIPPPPGV